MYNNIYNDDLKRLQTIIDNFTLTEPLSNKEKDDIKETMNELMHQFINDNITRMSNPNFETYLEDYVMENIEKQLIFSNLFPEDMFKETIMPILEIIYKDAYQLYFKQIMPKRCSGNTFIRNRNINIEKMQEKINYIKQKPQPAQKTNEWYTFRHNILTASSIWKALKSISTKNQLIYEKCSPLNVEKYNTVNMDSTLHHGNKYEDVSIMIYENKYNTKVEDFGCIQHDNYKFIGASPDGINVDAASPLFGRMLEIKNIVNREINGNPKEEYWIQMQVQMETCNLNECDFLETRFSEYEDEETFENDGTFNLSETGKIKGIMVCFMVDNFPKYEYAPLHLSKEAYEEWKEDIMEKHKDHTWLKDIYWKLEEYSCVLVLRNKDWFHSVVPSLENIWSIIEKERIEGYEHRKPKKIVKKKESKPVSITGLVEEKTNIEPIPIPPKQASKCLIEIDTSDLNFTITEKDHQDKLKDETHKN